MTSSPTGKLWLQWRYYGITFFSEKNVNFGMVIIVQISLNYRYNPTSPEMYVSIPPPPLGYETSPLGTCLGELG